MISEKIYRICFMKDVRDASAQAKFIVASMFANIGGSSIGYRLAGGLVVLANEFAAEAARTYSANFPDTVVDTRDILDIVDIPAAIEGFLAKAGLKRGDLDILDGSSPCTEFSTAGAGVSYNGGTASLIFHFCHMARTVLPKVVIGENVSALAKWEKYQPILHAALDTLRFAGNPSRRLYYVNFKVLLAADYGVPQVRERVFYIAIRKDVAEALGIRSDAGIEKLFPVATHPDPTTHVNIRAALAGLQQTESEIRPWLRAALVNKVGNIIRQLPREPAKPTKPKHVGLGTKTWFTLTRCSWDHPVPTLTAMGQQPNGLSGAIHPAEDRKFTVKEQMRLHGMPDDFQFPFPVTDAQASDRMGNMVPPLLMKAIAESIYKKVLQPYAESQRRPCKPSRSRCACT
jgi:DNA-cytosine methyltransferase